MVIKKLIKLSTYNGGGDKVERNGKELGFSMYTLNTKKILLF